MSMTIIGGDEKKIIVITDRKIINELDDIERKYKLYKDKYEKDINQNILSKYHKHYILQLCETFKQNDINKLVSEINYINSCTNLYDYIRYLLNKYKYIYILKDTIKHVKEKYNIELKDNLYEDINDIKKLDCNNELNIKLEIINKQITHLKNIPIISHKKIKLIDNWSESTIFMKDLKESIEYILSLNNLIKLNITPLYTCINDITDIFTKLYL
jgi:hypothetical protein